MNFRLQKQSTGPTLTKFYVHDSTNAIVGTINVANEQAEDLQKHWRGAPTPAAKPASGRTALANALLKGPKLNKAALLRS